MIFDAKQLQKKRQEQTTSFYTPVVDCLIRNKSGYQSRFVTVVRQFNDGISAHLLDDGNKFSTFEVTMSTKAVLWQIPSL
jgi:hypothetical protein